MACIPMNNGTHANFWQKTETKREKLPMPFQDF